MRFPFTNESVAMVNRVEGAAFKRTLREYGRSPIQLMGVLWLQVDLHVSDNDDSFDHVLDEYEILKQKWDEIRETERANADFDKSVAIAVEFEEKLWMAIAVVNAMEALEGGAGNIWASDELQQRVKDEFASERAEVNRRITAILASD